MMNIVPKKPMIPMQLPFKKQSPGAQMIPIVQQSRIALEMGNPQLDFAKGTRGSDPDLAHTFCDEVVLSLQKIFEIEK